MIAEDALKVLVDRWRPWLDRGEVSSYLPELSQAHSDELAVAIDLGGNGVITAGDHTAKFTLQSVVKVATLSMALHRHGKEYVLERVGSDQASGSYNSLETLHEAPGSPSTRSSTPARLSSWTCCPEAVRRAVLHMCWSSSARWPESRRSG